MGLLDRLLGKARPSDEVVGARVLVCAIGDRHRARAEEDASVYRQFYPGTFVETPGSVDEFLALLARGFDAVHLLCDLGPDGLIAGSGMNGTSLIAHCDSAGVKLLWIAQDNPSAAYVNGFDLRGRRMNLVMTLDRNGAGFGLFLRNLLSRMARGETMPSAWVALNNQNPRGRIAHEPSTICAIGYGSLILRG